MNKKEKIVISLGGSLIVTKDGVNIDFLSKFNKFIREKLSENKNRQFFIVVGGGFVARQYRDAGEKNVGRKLTADDLDWLGIHATRLNAHLVRTIFRDLAHPNIIKDYGAIKKIVEPVTIAAGWKPGWSTDYDAVLLCKNYGVDTVVNLSNISQVYDKDPRKFSDAKPINRISWKDFLVLVGEKWLPGMNAPFDPIAAQKAAKLGKRAIILKGDDIGNLDNYFSAKGLSGQGGSASGGKNKKFIGTIIE